MTSFLNIIVKFILFSLCLAIQAGFCKASNQITFSNWLKEDGLPSNYIYAFEKDEFGFLWIATNDGLCRYDGPNLVKIYRQQEGDPHITNSLQSNIIRSLFYDSKGYLWIGTVNGGLTSFNPSTNEWKTFRHNPQNQRSLSNDDVLTIIEDSKQRIWVGTENGLNMFNRKTETFTQFKLYNTKANVPTARAVLSVMEDKQGWIWAGTWSGGLHLFLEDQNGNFDTQNIRHFQTSSNKAANNVWALLQDKDENASNHPGNQNWKPNFTTYNKESNSFNYIKSNDIQSILQDQFNNLWIGTTHGLHKLPAELLPPLIANEQKDTLYFDVFLPSDNKSKIVGENITNLHEDDQGIIWIGTNVGLSQFNWHSNQFKSLNFSDPNFDIQFTPSFIMDSSENIWICRLEKGLLKYRIEDEALVQLKDVVSPLLLGKRVSTIHSPDGEWIYAGTELGITTVNIKTLKTVEYPTPPWFRAEIKDLFIKTILVDDEGTIWFGATVGLFRIDKHTKAFTLFEPDNAKPNAISDNAISHIIQDSYGTIWIATYKGLNKIIDPHSDEPQFESFFFNEHNPEKGSVNNQTIYLKEIGEYLYIGTTSGICRYRYSNCQFETFKASENKFRITSIEKGNKNDIWVSTNEGIFSFNEQENTVQIFDKKDGLINTSFRQGCSFKDADNNIYFAYTNGFTYFSPEEFSKNTVAPPVYITDVEIMSTDGIEVIDGINNDLIELNHKVYRLSVNFTALNYNRVDKNKYQYRLVGVEDQWNDAKFGTPIVCTKLEPNEYKLEIKASNNDGIWNEQGDFITIIQHPPYWKTWWFRLLAVLSIAVLIFSFFFWNTNKIRKHNEELQVYNKTLNIEIANRKKAEQQLQDYNKELKRSNKDLEQFAYIASHDLKEPLRVISGFSGLLSLKYSNKLDKDAKLHFGFIEEGVERMFNVIESLMTYSTVGQKDSKYSSINLNELIQNKVKDLAELVKDKNAVIKMGDLPEITGHKEQIGMVFFNLINNAIKFNTKKQPIVLINEIKGDSNYWKFSVTDNGIGIEAQYQEQIFGIFKRLHTKKEYNGSGIGLSVCQKIILRHEGVIWLDSKIDKGTTFYFTIKKTLSN